MSYPESMRKSIAKVNASRHERIQQSFPLLSYEEKTRLLETYHPDYNLQKKRKLRLGPNEGDLVPQELASILEGEPLIDPDYIDLELVDYQTDVLIIGGGGAGASAALIAAQEGAEVLLSTKLRLGDSNTIMAEGGIGAATEPSDSPFLHYLDTIGGGGFTNIPDLVEALVLEAPLVIEWLEELGVMFDRKEDGSILTHAPGGHSRRRSHSCKDLTGLEVMRVLRDEIRNRNINVLEFSPAVELILDHDGKCTGAILYNLDTQNYLVVRAKAVILATGGMGRLHINKFPTSNHYGATADGLVMAYRSGAELLYVDAVQYHPTGVAWPEQMLGLLITEALRAHGANLVNADGEIFINNLETRDAVASAIIRECNERKKGIRTPTNMVGVWLDTPMIDLIGGQGKMERQFAGITKRFANYDIDVTKEPILVYPTQHYQNGGIKINANTESTVPGLFVAGEASGGVHGRNRLGSNSLLDIFVFGRRAGFNAANYAKHAKLGRPNLDHVKEYKNQLNKQGLGGKIKSPILIPDYVNPDIRKIKYY